MTKSLQSSDSGPESKEPGGWFKVGAVAAASALAGGLVAAWWYRKTLSTLRQAEEDSQDPHFGISADDPAEEPTDES
jgi:hypothetical protein